MGKIVQFRTRLHPVDDMVSLLTLVKAEAGEDQMITVSCIDVQCANHYEVFQKINTSF